MNTAIVILSHTPPLTQATQGEFVGLILKNEAAKHCPTMEIQSLGFLNPWQHTWRSFLLETMFWATWELFCPQTNHHMESDFIFEMLQAFGGCQEIRE